MHHWKSLQCSSGQEWGATADMSINRWRKDSAISLDRKDDYIGYAWFAAHQCLQQLEPKMLDLQLSPTHKQTHSHGHCLTHISIFDLHAVTTTVRHS